MPLEEGSSNQVVSDNVKELMASGYPQKQSVAISLDKAGRGRKQVGVKKDRREVRVKKKD